MSEPFPFNDPTVMDEIKREKAGCSQCGRDMVFCMCTAISPRDESARLRAELAAEREARLTAERQRDEMAAALEAIRMHVRDQYIHFPGYGTLTIGEYIDEQDTRTILAARDTNQRRKGAAWAVRKLLKDREISDFPAHVRIALEVLLRAIERGEVEVGE